MEELVLTDPVVVPEKTTDKFRVASFTMNMDAVVDLSGQPGFVSIELRSNHGEQLHHQYTGNVAINMIKTLNTANLTTKSMQKRILEKLSNDGIIPGTVTGTPEPPVADDDGEI